MLTKYEQALLQNNGQNRWKYQPLDANDERQMKDNGKFHKYEQALLQNNGQTDGSTSLWTRMTNVK
jgi:hypothetical protein